MPQFKGHFLYEEFIVKGRFSTNLSNVLIFVHDIIVLSKKDGDNIGRGNFMKKRRWKKKLVSILLVLCMLGGYVPTQTRQVQALDLLSMFDIAGTMTRAGKTAMSQAKKENWSPLKAIPGTFKIIGKELLGLNNDESPGSTVVVNQVDLSQVESQLSDIQNTLKKQNLTLTEMKTEMKSSTEQISEQISELSGQIKDMQQQKKYADYLNGYFSFYNQFCEALANSEKLLNNIYAGDPTDKAIKNAYDRMYSLTGSEYTGDFTSAVSKLEKYLRGEYSATAPGSVIDVLCKYYELAGYDQSQIASAVKDFVALTYYTYCLSNYYHMSLMLYQNSYMVENNQKEYTTDFNVVLSDSEIENSFKTMLENIEDTTAHVFYDLNQHFGSAENQKINYIGTAGTAIRTMNGSKMDVEPGSSVTLPDSTRLLDSYFGSNYSKMFGNVCYYSYGVSDDAVSVESNKLSFDRNLAEGKEINVDMYCTVSDQKIKLHTYTFTCKAGELSGGYGTSEYPYVIKSVKDYETFAQQSQQSKFQNAKISLMTDLDFSGTLFTSVPYEFKGWFFGNGHKVSNINLTGLQVGYGIFTSLSGVVQDLTLENCDISPSLPNGGEISIGAIARTVNREGRIERCEVVNSRVVAAPNSGTIYLGGITGKLNGGSLKGCIVRNTTVSVGMDNVKGCVGGLIGYMNNSASVTYSGREEGDVTSFCKNYDSPGSYAGGLIGAAYNGTMNYCWSFRKTAKTSDFGYYEHFGTFVGLCSSLSSKGCIVYSGTDADSWNLPESTNTYGTKVQGSDPDVKKAEDFTCSKVSLDSEGYLTNSSDTGNPIRLRPVKIQLDTSGVKKSYYYGEHLDLNGLVVKLTRGDKSVLGVGLYDMDTKYDANKEGDYVVKISVGNLSDSYQVNVAKKPHTFEQVLKKPTCTREGFVYYQCTECGETMSEETLKAAGHKLVHHEEVLATCGENGMKEYWNCSACGKYFLDEKGENQTKKEELVLKTSGQGHKPEQTVIKATPSKDGAVTSVCSVCNQQLSTTTIPKIADVNLSIITYTYNGKVVTPTVTLKDGTGKVIDRSNYTVSYAAGRKNVGSYNVTVTLKGNYSGTVSKTFTIQPKSTTISQLKVGKKKLTVKWKKQTTQTTGYEIAYSTSKQFKNAKTTVIKKNKTTSKTLKKLKKKKYYVRIRTYKIVKVNGKSTKIYSTWSKAKNKKVK